MNDARQVLVVDDDREIIHGAALRLRAAGYKTLEARDGCEGLQSAVSHHPDAIVMDVRMPNMDGITFVKHIRQNDKTTPIIMVTTESEKSRVIEAIKAGVNNYVVKPFTPDSLSQRITETLTKKAA